MSELEKKLVGKAINKKQVIAVILIAGFLVSFFTFSIFLTKSLLGSQRPLPSENLENSEEEDAELIMPPYPFDLEDLMELFENMSQDQQEELAESLADMMDGNIDDLDLLKYGALIGALLFSNVEKFTVYDYDEWNAENLSKILWKYETYDIFNGTSWKTSATKSDSNFYSYDNYTSEHPDSDIMQLKMPLSPKVGINSFVLPSRFPTPFIMEDSLSVNNINPGSVRLYRDDFNSSTLDLEFYSDAEVNMYYELFGLPLPSNEEVNNSAVGEEYTPESIQDQYLQLPPDVNGYIEANPYFQTHYNALDDIIETDDNAFEIANKIRNYMQVNFELSMDARNNDPPKEGEDIVEWFCEHEEGVYSDFASAYCAFTRAFGVASRFIDGFNSRNIEEEYDESEGKNSFVIRYRNIYNWAEIYVPTETSGQGSWVQMDILFETFGAGGQVADPPELPSSYYLNLETEKEVYDRGEQANITATLISPTDPVEDQTIRFRDNKTGVSLGTRVTDYWGRASLLLDVDDTFDVGPKFIVAEYVDDTSVSNITNFIVDGNVSVFLNEPQPSEMNRTLTNYTTLSGYAYDPLTGSNLSNTLINLSLYLKDTNTFQPYAFNPSLTYTDSEGNFSETVQVDSYVGTGEFKIRADFNGSWSTVQGSTYPNINASSNYQDFNITEKITYSLFFYVNGTPTNYPYRPSSSNLFKVKRGETLNLTALLIRDNDGSPVSSEEIEFYNYSDSLHTQIGSATTGTNGKASISISIPSQETAGPKLVYAVNGPLKNYSYYIVNHSLSFANPIGPSPNEINRSGSIGIFFDVYGELIDPWNSQKSEYADVYLRMYRNLNDNTHLLSVTNPIKSSDGIYDINNLEVQDSTPRGNYTLRFEFEGDFDFTSDTNNPYQTSFRFQGLSTTNTLLTDLKVIDPDNLNISLYINGSATTTNYNDGYLPERYKSGDKIGLEIDVNYSNDLNGIEVVIYDDYIDNELRRESFGSSGTSGTKNFLIDTSELRAGLNRLSVRCEDPSISKTFDTINKTYIIINKSVNIFANANKESVQRQSITFEGEGFTISGSIKENLDPMRGLIVGLYMYDSFGNDYSYAINYAPGYGQNITIDNNGEFTYLIDSIANIPYGRYNLTVNFTGGIEDLTDTWQIELSDYMIHNQSDLIYLNVTAGTNFVDTSYDTENVNDSFYYGDTLNVIGNLTWDDTNGIGNNINVTVIIKTSDGTQITNKTKETETSYGFFNISLQVGIWPDDVEVWIEFVAERSDGFSSDHYYIESTEQQVYRS